MSIAQNWLAGISAGRQHRMQDEAIAKQNRLGQLAGQAFGAAPEQRGGILSQVAEVDPNAAFAMQDRFAREDQSAEQAKHARLTNMAKMLAAAPEPMRGGLYAQMVPSLRGMGLQAPDAWDDSLMGVVQSLAGTDQQGAQSAQRAYVEWMASQIPEAERGEFFRVQAGLAPKAQNQQFAIKDVENADGTVSFVPIATRGGNVAGAAPTAAPRPSGATGALNMDAILAQANVLARQGVPDAQIEQFIARAAQQQGVQVTPATMDDRANATLDAQTYGTSPAGAAPGGQATNATRAAAAAEAAAQKVRAETLARAEAEREAEAPQRQRANRVIEDTIKTVQPVINRAIKNTSGWTTGFGSWLSVVPMSDAKDFSSDIETLQARLSFDELAKMRAASPTGGALGAVSERELVLLGATVRSLEQSQSPERMRENLRAIKRHYDRWLMTVRGINPDDPNAPTGEGAAASSDQADSALDDVSDAAGEQPQSAAAPTPAQLPQGARRAPDGNFYVQQGGRWFRVEQ